MVARLIVVRNKIFKGDLHIMRIKIRHLKGANKWKIVGVNYTHENECIWL